MNLFLLLLGLSFVTSDEIWEKEVSEDMKIGVSLTGYDSVDLRCGADAFHLNVTLEEEFEGVIYTRGSYSNKKYPCYRTSKAENVWNEGKNRIYTLRIPFDKCQTVMDVTDSKYTNTLVIQQDVDLIMPGDAAFELECAFQPEFRVESELTANSNEFKSRITLIDADPAAVAPKETKYSKSSHSEHVSFRPNAPIKDEL